ncbi:MAG: low molecular weight protein arginine phosphatase [Alphaproteobacteria bacterium]|nr:low molecular weight protein arginine phosphatase [Alphaproteobacteria bacterium]MCB9699446.1 low molecular weight protein arginine phosphatase [Alphaproteobacteria bacterium]
MRLLFVCTGNLCRSPMAAALADRVALELDLEVDIRSAGTAGIVGEPAHPKVVAACREIGIDLTGHTSSALDLEAVTWADRIYVMESAHAVAVRELLPSLPEEAVVQLGSVIGKAAIDDPIGSWFMGPYRRARDELATAVRAAMKTLVTS